MNGANDLQGSVTICDTPIQRLKSLRDTSMLSWRQIASQGEFEGIPAGTLATIAKTGKIPKKYRSVFYPHKPRVAHVCKNCVNYKARTFDYQEDDWGVCKSNERSGNQNGGVLVCENYGCRFWRRKEGL